MKKFLLRLILFLLCTSLIYVSGILIAGKLLPKSLLGNLMVDNSIRAHDGSARRFTEARKHDPIDIMILGSSHAYRGYDVRIFKQYGFSAYNLGSSSQPLQHSMHIYRAYVDILQPKYLIIDIYPRLLILDGTESILNTLPLFYDDKNTILYSLETRDIRILNSLLYFNVYGNKNNVHDKLKKHDKYVVGGYIEQKDTAVENKKYDKSKLIYTDQNIKALQSIIDDAKRRGIEVLLLQAPLPRHRYASYENNNEIDSLIGSKAAYYNSNEELFIDKQFFYDDSHLNQKGVDIYDKWVMEKLEKIIAR